MGINHLDHVNLRTAQLDTLVAWYGDVLALRAGYRPPFSFPSAWLYADGKAVIHIVGTDAPARSKDNLSLEHFAFRASDAAGFEARLRSIGQDYRRVEVASNNTIAINLWDPDGNHIHVDFPLDE